VIKKTYIAFLFKDSEISDKYIDNNTGYNVIIPDIKDAYTCGDDIKHSLLMAKDISKLLLEDCLIIPKSHTIDYFTNEKLKEFNIPVTAKPYSFEINYKERKEQVTVKLTINAKKIIDEYAKLHNLTRSAFLEQSALQVAMNNY
jgi:predicted RNase H-like HicB family nuclease